MKDLVNSFSIIHRQSVVMLERRLRTLDLTFGQFVYILALSGGEGMSQEQLAHLLLIDKGAIARTTQQLLARGYVRREKSPEDRRQYKLYATEKARDVYAQMVEIHTQWERKMTQGLTAIEADILRSLLEKVVEAMKE